MEPPIRFERMTSNLQRSRSASWAKEAVKLKTNVVLLNHYLGSFQNQFEKFEQESLLDLDDDFSGRCIDDYMKAIFIIDRNLTSVVDNG